MEKRNYQKEMEAEIARLEVQRGAGTALRAFQSNGPVL